MLNNIAVNAKDHYNLFVFKKFFQLFVHFAPILELWNKSRETLKTSYNCHQLAIEIFE